MTSLPRQQPAPGQTCKGNSNLPVTLDTQVTSAETKRKAQLSPSQMQASFCSWRKLRMSEAVWAKDP